ncbi:hypothetical protein [Streptomyces resistomycificus]|uniref:hypothetical protein n=1 Tax=Streptomyces resistomycificus TaxID=67356 RepID=UPI001CEDBE42|nr:hypothetical protein [Streptomyces resistomycificus]
MIISERTALSWVLSAQRMAFPPIRARAAQAINAGDEVLLYSTRGCFGRPERDLGRVFGHATVASSVHTLAEPVVFGERNFTEGCELTIHGLTPFREGVSLRDHVHQLTVFPDPKSWNIRMRRASLPLPEADAALLRNELHPLLKPYAETVEAYRWPR